MKKTIRVFVLFAAVVMVASCGQKPNFDYFYYTPEEQAVLERHLNLPALPNSYKVEFPAHLAAQGLFPRLVNDDKAVLGRVLFYDKNLSKDKTIACASCHKQEVAFGDNTATSKGVQDRQGERNSISLGSVANFSAYYGTDLNGSSAIRFFWDNRAETAKEQAKGSLTNTIEMDMHMSEIVEAVRNQEYYKPLFSKAFGGFTVSEENVLDAISNFVDAMGSYKSKFDVEAAKKYAGGYYYGDEQVKSDFTGFTAQENTGKNIYMNKCGGCHSPVMGRPVYNNANNGLDVVTGTDRGVGAISNASSDEGTFKIPTLRNIALTAPFMHDGRHASLDEVIEHYSSGIKNHKNLSAFLPVGGFQFTAQEKADLKAFLLTLTDNTLANEERYSNPFK